MGRGGTGDAEMIQTSGPSPWMTAQEAAAYMKRTLRTIQNWTSDGRIRVYYPDSRPVYNREDLDAYIRSTAKPAAKQGPVLERRRA
jgi:excisionase family DNA binding protein